MCMCPSPILPDVHSDRIFSIKICYNDSLPFTLLLYKYKRCINVIDQINRALDLFDLGHKYQIKYLNKYMRFYFSISRICRYLALA